MSNTTLAADCTAARNEARTRAEIDTIVDRMLADAAAAPVTVQPVNCYRKEVDDMESGRAFMRAGVDSGQCKYMELIRVTAMDSGVEMLWVVDNEGGRALVRWCNLIGATWKTLETRGIVRLVPAVAK